MVGGKTDDADDAVKGDNVDVLVFGGISFVEEIKVSKFEILSPLLFNDGLLLAFIFIVLECTDDLKFATIESDDIRDVAINAAGVGNNAGGGGGGPDDDDDVANGTMVDDDDAAVPPVDDDGDGVCIGNSTRKPG